MVREVFTPHEPVTVAGTGPYAIPWPYLEAAQVRVLIDTGLSVIELDPADYTVAPEAGQSGNVTLEAGAAAAHAGALLLLRRRSQPQQGWQGVMAREVGLEAQLDWLTQAVQEHDDAMDRAVKVAFGTAGELPVARENRLVAFDDEGALTAGPPVADWTSVHAPDTVGAFGFFRCVGQVLPGATKPGSSLRYGGIREGGGDSHLAPSSQAPTGTWRALGYHFDTGFTLWQKISED